MNYYLQLLLRELKFTLYPCINPCTEKEWNKKISVRKVIHLFPSLNGHRSEKRTFSMTLFKREVDGSDLNS